MSMFFYKSAQQFILPSGFFDHTEAEAEARRSGLSLQLATTRALVTRDDADSGPAIQL
jgi:hypothetical protein